MACIDCGYSLVNLNRGRCPECGRAFDPGNHKSFRHSDSEPAPLPFFHAFFVVHMALYFPWLMVTIEKTGIDLRSLLAPGWPIRVVSYPGSLIDDLVALAMTVVINVHVTRIARLSKRSLLVITLLCAGYSYLGGVMLRWVQSF